MTKRGNWLFRYRGMLPLLILVVGLTQYAIAKLNPEQYALLSRAPYIYEKVCLGVSLLGLAVRAFTVGYTPAGTSGRNTATQIARKLNTTGLYSVVRNPLYLGNFLMWLGIAMLTANLWFVVAFSLFYWLYYERIIMAEEDFLATKFGKEYTEWADGTPCFIPRLSGYVKPSIKFSWKKVLKKEKNGLLALLAIFCLMDVSGQMLINQPPRHIWLIYAAGISLFLYLVLKYLKHRTAILDEAGR